jgi:hypothetical protein
MHNVIIHLASIKHGQLAVVSFINTSSAYEIALRGRELPKKKLRKKSSEEIQ